MSRGSDDTRYGALAAWCVPAAPLLGLAAFFLLGWGDTDGLPDPTHELAVWKVLITVQVVVWTVFAGAGLRGLARLRDPLRAWNQRARARRWGLKTLGFVVLIYVLVVPMFVVGAVEDLQGPFLVPGQEWKVPLLHLLGATATAPFFVGLKRIQLAAVEDTPWSTSAEDIERVRSFRRFLRTATTSVGVIIALALVSTGALRHAVTAAGLEPLPQAFVLVYGAWFTGILSGAYLYVFAALDERARSIVDAAVALPDPDPRSSESFLSCTKLRAELAHELEMGGDPRKNLEGLIAVFSPLAGALLSQLGGVG